MKNNFNINNHVLTSKSYLYFLSEKIGEPLSMYDKFCMDHDLNHYLKPYIYTFSLMDPSEIEYFWIFYNNYLIKSGINDLENVSINDYIAKISNDDALLVTFIIAAQYYFL